MSERNNGLKKATIPLTQAELDLVDLWAFENRVGSRISALRALLGLGCKTYFGFDSDADAPRPDRASATDTATDEDTSAQGEGDEPDAPGEAPGKARRAAGRVP